MQTPKQQQQEATNKLMDTCGVFWAFSNKQMEEGKLKSPLAPGEKYISIGAGGYIPQNNFERLTDGLDAIKVEFNKAMQDEKARIEHITYELNNHEAYYTGDIEDTMDALGDSFTVEEVLKVFNSYKND